jgi:transcriptional regulator with XRE-family HTH domain
MPSNHPLGYYLRARRELLLPGEVGLAEDLRQRRVPGLRRSEVATLAGISTEYYVKLEQGKGANPTDQVLDALSRALKLDLTARSYLHALARLSEKPVTPTLSPATERAQWLIDSWPMTAAMILDRHNDIVATNSLMSSLVPEYLVGSNALVVLLVDQAVRQLYLEWEGLSSRSIGLLRSHIGLAPDDPRAQELVAQLLRESERFAELWHRYDIQGMTEGIHPMNHPTAGRIDLHYAHLPLAGADGHTIFMYFADPGSATELALAALGAGR